MLYLPTTREGYMYALGWYIHGVKVQGLPMWSPPKEESPWRKPIEYSWIPKKEVSKKDERKAARGNL